MNDRKNLLESTQIATVFLDGALRIKTVTPAITDVFRLIETDIGRPLTDIVTRLDYHDLERDVRKVLRTLARIEHEVSLSDGSASFMMRILPYRTTDNVVDGVVVTFIDITERKRSEQNLARLASIVAESYDGVIGLTPEGTISAWNAGAERIYGYTAGEAVGQSLSAILGAAELRGILDRVKRSRKPTIAETRRTTKDGRLLYVSSSVSPIRDHAGKVTALSMIDRDVTAGKQAEERSRLLLAELNHRVKNTLATVLSISSQTLRHSSTMKSFHEAFEGRVRALAKAHDLLATSNWTGADLRDVALAEVTPYREKGDHLSLDGGSLILAPNAALILGMVFHELATNAAKHGAFSTDAGRVAIRWKTGGRGQRLNVDWIERGGPKIAREKDGFGLALVKRGITHELQGRATIDFKKGGLRCLLDIPLAEVQPPSPGRGTRQG